MLISHKCKFITIDIPKTGTRSLRESLRPLNVLDIIGGEDDRFKQHGTALECKYDLQGFLGYDFDEYLSFCIVRNPWERYLSFFRYYKDKAESYLNTQDIQFTEEEIKQVKNSFDLFNTYTNQQVLKIIILNNRQQSDYYLNHNNENIISYIADFSYIEKEFNYFCTKVGLGHISLKHENKSTKIVYDNIYNQELIDLVADKEKDVIELKGYKYQT